VTPLLQQGLIKGMAHITGGGITENLPRTLPAGCGAAIDRRTWTVPPVFSFIASRGEIASDEMLRAFNMGIGLIVVCAAAVANQARQILRDNGEPHAVVIGEVVPGEGVRYTS
jgi:phosphoribosylformylglycinamidine cyclo-ligase